MSRVVATGSLPMQTRSVSRVMTEVMLALLPGTLLYAWLIHPNILLNMALAVVFSAAFEALALRLRRRAIRHALKDGSIALSACLLALAVTPLLPWWQLAIGCAAMTLLGKQLYGGLGNNPFNPAMVGYAVLIVSFPLSMTQWPVTGPGESVAGNAIGAVTGGVTDPAAQPGTPPEWDALTGATPLDRLRERSVDVSAATDAIAAADAVTGQQRTVTASALPDDVVLDSPWPWISVGWLVGGLALLWRKLITWHIPASMLGTLAMLQAFNGLLSQTPQLSVIACLLSGGIMLGAFFIATDPVSAASSRKGQLVFGAGIGCLAFFIREFSAYPEGVAFAVLLMNLCVPLIDYFTTPTRWS